jgi:hypothetical protein
MDERFRVEVMPVMRDDWDVLMILSDQSGRLTLDPLQAEAAMD